MKIAIWTFMIGAVLICTLCGGLALLGNWAAGVPAATPVDGVDRARATITAHAANPRPVATSRFVSDQEPTESLDAMTEFEWGAFCDTNKCHFESMRPYGNFWLYTYSLVDDAVAKVICCDSGGNITSIYVTDAYGNGVELID